MIKTDKRKILSKICVTLLVIALISTSFLFFYERNKNNNLQDDYDNLNSSHNSYEIRYNLSSNSYNNLLKQYDEVHTEYIEYLEDSSKYNKLPIDHFMELSFSDIRTQNQPHYSPWMSIETYDSLSVEYASYICAHDLGRYYWPDIEKNYYDKTGGPLYTAAYERIQTLVEIINISKNFSHVENVKRVLDFTISYITYQDDPNDEFLFPTETLTFRTGDCDDFSILTAAVFEEIGIQSAIGFFENKTDGLLHAMLLLNLDDLGKYEYYSYSNLTSFNLSEGQWIIIEPQLPISRQRDIDFLEKYELLVASEIPE